MAGIPILVVAWSLRGSPTKDEHEDCRGKVFDALVDAGNDTLNGNFKELWRPSPREDGWAVPLRGVGQASDGISQDTAAARKALDLAFALAKRVEKLVCEARPVEAKLVLTWGEWAVRDDGSLRSDAADEAHDGFDALSVDAVLGSALAVSRLFHVQLDDPSTARWKTAQEPVRWYVFVPRSRDLAEIRARIAAILDSSPALREALGAEIPTDDLLDTKALPLCQAINRCMERLRESDARRALWRLLQEILPWAADWNATVRALRDPGRLPAPGGGAGGWGERRVFEIPFHTGTLAEAVLAGLDQRACRFVELPLRGEDNLDLPPALSSPLLLSDRTTGEALVQELAYVRPVLDGLCSRFSYASPFKDPEKLARAVNGGLLADADDGHIRSLLVFGEPFGEEGSEAWANLSAALQRLLPALRLVRLAPADITQDTRIARLIEIIATKALKEDSR